MGTATFSGIDSDILLGGERAPMTVMKLTVERGSGAPAHISHSEDKVFLIDEGQLVFLVGTEKFEASFGEVIFVNKGTIHSFTPLDCDVARMTLISTPSRHDRFFQAMSNLSLGMDELQSVFEHFEQSIVGPVVNSLKSQKS